MSTPSFHPESAPRPPQPPPPPPPPVSGSTAPRVDDRYAAPIEALVALAGGDSRSFDGRLVSEMIQTCLRLISDGQDTGQLKLVNSALKEMRHAYRVFNRYRGRRKVSIFGSARTPENHPDYVAARDFSAILASHGWMSITGAGDGIMKAGHEGPQRESSFGLSIRLPFETTANEVIEGDPKLINFRYFFTRKLMFMSHADAFTVLPGGYGTQDELFEALVLIQTGKSNIVPVVLLEGEGGDYWTRWQDYISRSLLGNRWISPEDPSIFHRASSPAEAVEHILAFYRVFHSYRYVGDDLVIRLLHPLSDADLAVLEREFADLCASGGLRQAGALPQETDHLELPRLVFHHTRRSFGRVRQLIDRINRPGGSAGPAPGGAS
ncbi:MAG: LOG family protein [Phycisphaeraceae bacterium]|nr:LOG family protein [Phycisphaeraceae bacterium]